MALPNSNVEMTRVLLKWAQFLLILIIFEIAGIRIGNANFLFGLKNL